MTRNPSEEPIRFAQGSSARLVLLRWVGEKVVADSSICVVVVAIKGDKARRGVAAPTSIRVDRLEVHKRRLVSPLGS